MPDISCSPRDVSISSTLEGELSEELRGSELASSGSKPLNRYNTGIIDNKM